MTTNELAASNLAANPAALRKRLEQAKQVLADELRRGFGKGRFDYAMRTLTGANGIVLTWRLRHRPEQPESYENQQTTIGSVYVSHNRD